MPVSPPVIKTIWVFIQFLLEKFPARFRILTPMQRFIGLLIEPWHWLPRVRRSRRESDWLRRRSPRYSDTTNPWWHRDTESVCSNEGRGRRGRDVPSSVSCVVIARDGSDQNELANELRTIER